MALTALDIARANIFNDAYYTPKNTPGTTIAGSNRMGKSQLLKTLGSIPIGERIGMLDETKYATNMNDVWQIYGDYWLDDKGVLHRETSKTTHQDIGQKSGFGSFGGWLGDIALNALTGGIYDLYKGITKGINAEGSFWDKLATGIDRAIDPGGSIDRVTRYVGSKLPQGVRNIAPAAGAIIGSILYPVAGTAAGYGIGSKLKGEGYKEGFIGAGIAAGSAYLGGLVGSEVMASTGSKILSKAAGMAAKNIASTAAKMGLALTKDEVKKYATDMAFNQMGIRGGSIYNSIPLTSSLNKSVESTGASNSDTLTNIFSSLSPNYTPLRGLINKGSDTIGELTSNSAVRALTDSGMGVDNNWFQSQSMLSREEQYDYLRAIQQLRGQV